MLRKTAIISGGFGDIGKATAEKFAANGYNVALTYLNSFDQDFLQKLKSYNVEAMAIRVDQSKENDIINFVNTVFAEFEYVDSCVLAAGKAEPEGFLYEKNAETIDEIINVNFRGTILFAREIIKHFSSQKHGSLVIISSIYGETGGSLEAVYSACKAGINGLVKSLAIESAPHVRVNAIAPGFISTKMTNHYTPTDLEYIKNQTPLAKLGTPSDVANSALFLASEESSFITGEILTVSGGALRL